MFSVPPYIWNNLTQDDKNAFFNLKETFHNSNSPILCKEKDKSNFTAELETIRKFIESRSVGIEERSIVAGIAFQPSFLSVNIQRLKTLLNRCKSSINKGFQQINYISEKSQVKSHVLKSIPLLNIYQSELRQWTIRIPNNGSKQFSKGFTHFQFSSQPSEIGQNIKLTNCKLQSDTPILSSIIHEKTILPPLINDNLLPTPYINNYFNLDSNNGISHLLDQNLKSNLIFNSSNHQIPAQKPSNKESEHITPMQTPPEIRLCNSQFIESNFSIDDFDISNSHDFGMNEEDPYSMCNNCSINDSCAHADNDFEFSHHFRTDDVYSDYYNHDDPQDDDIGLNNTSDNNGSSIDIRNNFSS